MVVVVSTSLVVSVVSAAVAFVVVCGQFPGFLHLGGVLWFGGVLRLGCFVLDNVDQFLDFPHLWGPLGGLVNPPVSGPSLWRVSSVFLVSLDPMVVVVSTSLVVSAVSNAAAFMAVVFNSLILGASL